MRREPVLWEMKVDIPVSSPLMRLSGPPDTTQSCGVPALSPDAVSRAGLGSSLISCRVSISNSQSRCLGETWELPGSKFPPN